MRTRRRGLFGWGFAGKRQASVQVGSRWEDVESCELEDGVVDQRCMGPFESRSRGKNWMAVIYRDIRSPGGLRREWVPRVRGRSSGLYDVSGVRPGDYLEIGGDYYTGGGSRRPDRRIVRVLEVTEDQILYRDAGRPGKVRTAIEEEWERKARF